MLKFLSRRKSSRKVVLMIFVGLLALGLIGVFLPGITGLKAAPGDDAVIARVGHYKVALKDLKDRLSAFGQQMSQGQGAMRRDDPATIYALYGETVLDELVRQKIVQYEAEQLNFSASDTEVQSYIRSLPVFRPWPGAQRYREFLQQKGLTPFQFEDTIRASLAEQKLQSFVTAAVQVSAAEVEEEYRRNNTHYVVRWVDVNPEQLRSKVVVADADLQSYFEQHKSDFHIGAEQRRAKYIFIDQSKAGETISISDDELKQDFNPQRGVQQVRVSQIVLNIPKEKPAPKDKSVAGNAKPEAEKSTDEQKPDPGQVVRDKANDLIRRAKGEGGKPVEDFGKLAREASDDSKSKAAGGDIGWVNKKDKRDTDDPLNGVFSMQKDEVSQPIRKGDKFYILKATDRKMPTFEDSREQLLKEARARKGYTKAVEIATEAEQKFKENKNPDAVVTELNARHKAPVARVKETPFFAQGDNLPDLGAAPDFQSSLFGLENPGDISERQNVSNGFAVAQYLEKRDPHDPMFDEVKSKVEDRYRAEKSKDLAAERARKLAEAQSPDALKAAADSLGLKAEERAGLSGNDSIGALVNESGRSRIYKLNAGEVTHEPIKADNSDSLIVAALVNRADADMGDKFQKERKSIEERQRDAKAGIAYSTFLAAAEKRLKDAGKVKIYQDVIDRAMESLTPEEGTKPQRPGAPIRPGPRRTPQGPARR